MTQDVYFQGQKLPPLREGNVWAMRIWPGGRKEVKQVKQEQLTESPRQAVDKLLQGEYVYVWLDEAAYIVARWEDAKEDQTS